MELKSFVGFGAIALVLSLPLALRADDSPGEALVKRNDCLTCHAVNHKVVGPAYMDVAKKYKGASAAQIQTLVKKVKTGGSGNWGSVPMAAHPNVPDADIETMVKWVLSRTPANIAAEAAAMPKIAPTPVPVAAAPVSGAAVAAAPTIRKSRPSHLRSEDVEEVMTFDTDDEVRALMQKQDCYGCHSGVRRDGVADEMPWPSFAKIEAKYKNTKDIEPIVKKVRLNEGKETWGTVPHPTYVDLPQEAVEKMVAYIIDGKATKGVEVQDPNSMPAEEWMRKAADCFSCHSVNNKVVGPAYRDVAKRYAGASDAQIKILVKKVRLGGSGNWGNVPMAAHPNATDAQLEKAVRWVLQQK